MVQPFPAPSLRELLSAAKLRECSLMVALGRWFTHRLLLALKFLSGYVHRGTLPQSRIRSTAPSGREPGTMGLYHSTCRSETGRFRAIFIAPTEGGCHSSCRSETGRGRAIFIAPTEGGCHSSCRSETARLRAIFIAPTKGVCRSLGGAA